MRSAYEFRLVMAHLLSMDIHCTFTLHFCSVHERRAFGFGTSSLMDLEQIISLFGLLNIPFYSDHEGLCC